MKIDVVSTAKAREILKPLSNDMAVGTNLSDIRYEGVNQYRTNGTKFFFSEPSFRYFCSLMGIQPDALQKCSEELRAQIVEALIHDKEMDVNLIVDKPSKQVKEIINAEYPYVNSLDVFDTAVDTLKEWKPKTIIEVDHRVGIVMYFITEEGKEVKKVGDTVKAGIVLKHRVTRMHPEIALGPFSFTLQCTNGMISRMDKANVIKANSADKLINSIRALSTKWFDTARQHTVPRLVHTAEVPANGAAQTVHDVAKEMKIGPTAKDEVLDRLPALSDNPSLYQVINLVTNLANDQPLETRLRMQQFGGRLLETSECRCPNCKRVL